MRKADSPVPYRKKRKPNSSSPRSSETKEEGKETVVQPSSPSSDNVNLENALRLGQSFLHNGITQPSGQCYPGQPNAPELEIDESTLVNQWPMGAWQQVGTNPLLTLQVNHQQNLASQQAFAGNQASFQQAMQMNASLRELLNFHSSQVNNAAFLLPHLPIISSYSTQTQQQRHHATALSGTQATGQVSYPYNQPFVVASNSSSNNNYAPATEARSTCSSGASNVPQIFPNNTTTTTAPTITTSTHAGVTGVPQVYSDKTTTVSRTTSDTNASIRLRPYDVLLGRGRKFRYNPGNVRMHLIVSLHREAYSKGDREAKAAIRRKIVNFIKFQSGEKNGKFLKFDKASNEWLEVSDSEAQDKIGHAIRDGASTENQLNVDDPEILKEMEQSLVDSAAAKTSFAKRRNSGSSDGSSSNTNSTAATIREWRDEAKFLAGIFSSGSDASSSRDDSDDASSDEKPPGR